MSGQTANGAHSEEKKNNKAVIIIIVLLAVIVLVLVAVIAFLLGRQNAPASQDTAASSEAPREVIDSARFVLDEESAANVVEDMRKQVAEGMFECNMAYEWTFLDGKTESSDAYVANSSSNTHPILFDVYIDNTDELLYSSPVLPVGTVLRNIKLDKELPAGSYQASCHYKLLSDEETQETISEAEFVITINVLN